MRWGFRFLAIIIVLASCDSKKPTPLFQSLEPGKSGVIFANLLQEDSLNNILEYLYFYNGGGVATGDLNNDGKPEIFFTGNRVNNKLYLNEGELKFRDITKEAKIPQNNQWSTGVSMADLNGDGWLDILISQVGEYKHFSGKNQILINNHDLTFTNRASEVGLDFSGLSTQMTVLDYDRDGDLDVYLLNHSVHSVRSYGRAELRNQSDSLAGDILFRNELIPTGDFHFTNVTDETGIYNSQIGFGLGVAVSDFNRDGYSDLYISNDFHENDYLYLNTGRSFTEITAKAFRHTSRFSMGATVGDINNDLNLDLLTLDMQPLEEKVLKASMPEDNFEILKFKQEYGYLNQVTRNCMQVYIGSKGGNPIYLDKAPLLGIHATDWSWGSLIEDFNNDGWNDVFITTGIFRRPNDQDYAAYIANANSSGKPLTWKVIRSAINKMPEGKTFNKLFLNTGGGFKDVGVENGFNLLGYTTGHAAADLDSDGDLDLVTNNLNTTASIYINQCSVKSTRINLQGNLRNPFAYGARVEVYADTFQAVRELNPIKGWMSSSEVGLFFGTAGRSKLDSIIVYWPNGLRQRWLDVNTSQPIQLNYDSLKSSVNRQPTRKPILMEASGFEFSHTENPFNPFNKEYMIPHMMSDRTPNLKVADINGDGLEDLFVGGSYQSGAGIYYQNTGAGLTFSGVELDSIHREWTGACFMDIDNDGDLDLVTTGGGQELIFSAGTQLRIYVNDKGVLHYTKSQIDVFTNSSAICPIDFESDGDLDLFVGGSVIPGQYGLPPKSYLLMNNGQGQFSDVSGKLPIIKAGMVTSVVCTDVNKDSLPDLILAGEFMPITIWINQQNGFRDATNQYGLADSNGMWNTMVITDVDNDGDNDLVAGNAGLNLRLKPTKNEPLNLYINDYDQNGTYDQILTYRKDGREVPVFSRDLMLKQIPPFRKVFPNYKLYSEATIHELLNPEQIKQSMVRSVYTLENSIFVFEKGKFTRRPLPAEAQLFPVYSIEICELTGDTTNDIILTGNQFGWQPEIGSNDAGYGIVLKGSGTGKYLAIPPSESGLIIQGEVRSSVQIMNQQGKRFILFGINNGKSTTYQVN